MALFVSLLLAAVAFTVSVRSFMEKGFPINNAYIFASAQERKAMDPKPYYRQSAVVFGLLGTMFSLIAIAELSGAGWLSIAVCAVALVTVVYAMASSVREATKDGRR